MWAAENIAVGRKSHLRPGDVAPVILIRTFVAVVTNNFIYRNIVRRKPQLGLVALTFLLQKFQLLSQKLWFDFLNRSRGPLEVLILIIVFAMPVSGRTVQNKIGNINTQLIGIVIQWDQVPHILPFDDTGQVNKRKTGFRFLAPGDQPFQSLRGLFK